MNYTVTKVIMFPFLSLGMALFGDKVNNDHKILRAEFTDENGKTGKTDIGYDMKEDRYVNLPDSHFNDPMNPTLIDHTKLGMDGLRIFRQIEAKVKAKDYEVLGL